MKQSKHSKTYEITLSGYNGSTDETDHLVVWIGADSLEAVMTFLSRAHPAATLWQIEGNIDNLVDYDLPKDREELKDYIAKHSIPC